MVKGATGQTLSAYVADRLNRLQYLSIRHYLGFVFVSLVGLLLVLAIWP